MRYLGYGLPVGELISEGNLGLMQAVERFEPERASAFPLTRLCGFGRRYKNMS